MFQDTGQRDTPTDQPDDGATYQMWVGKDYYNPFVKDFAQLAEPLQGAEKYAMLCLSSGVIWCYVTRSWSPK